MDGDRHLHPVGGATEPRRGRVLAAKGVVLVLSTLVGWALLAGLSALASLVVQFGASGVDVQWALNAPALFGELSSLAFTMALATTANAIHFAAAATLWVVIPGIIGVVRSLRAEVK